MVPTVQTTISISLEEALAGGAREVKISGVPGARADSTVSLTLPPGAPPSHVPSFPPPSPLGARARPYSYPRSPPSPDPPPPPLLRHPPPVTVSSAPASLQPPAPPPCRLPPRNGRF